MLRLASFNLFWFPSSSVAENQRTPDDEERIARVIERLDADAIVFQEILDAEALGRTLDRVSGRRYAVIQSAPAPAAGEMRVIAAIDETRIDRLEARPIVEPVPERRFAGRRAPLAMVLRDRHSNRSFRLVGAHFKSGLPSTPDPENDKKRRWEAECIAAFLAEASSPGASLPTFVLGDFNLEADRPALAPLEAGSPAEWIPSRVTDAPPEHGGAEVEPDERWSTLLDRVIIDHAFVSGGGKAWLKGKAVVYAFDLDRAFFAPKSHGTPFFQVVAGSNVFLKPYAHAPKQEVRGMYRVSDHRPLRIEIEPV